MLARTVLMARGRQGRGSQTGRARVCSFDGEGEKKKISSGLVIETLTLLTFRSLLF